MQARLSSTRFPGKMLCLLGTIPLVEYVYRRCCHAEVDSVAVITSKETSDDPLYRFCMEHDIPVFRGELYDVLDRYIQAARQFNSDVICRVCGDSPFVDIDCINKMFYECAHEPSREYMTITNCLHGFRSEIIHIKTLEHVWACTDSRDDREHVTRYIVNNLNQFNFKIIDSQLMPEGLERITLTIDYPQDLMVANRIIRNGLDGFGFTSCDVITILKKLEGI
ncbi:MAG: cytidylyltransferase domain-containing protein [bacterium]